MLCEIISKIANKNVLYYFNLTNDGLNIAKNIRQHTKNIYNIENNNILTNKEMKFKEKLLTCYNSQKSVINHTEIFLYIKHGIISKVIS